MSIAKIDVNTSPVEIGVECLVCGKTVVLGPAGYNYSYVPKICNECKRRLMLALYPEREEGEP